MEIGSKIKEKRKSKKLTQKELGKKVGLSEQAISQYERGEREPKIETLNRIAEVLGITISELTFNYSFSYELLIYLIRVINTENYFDFIEKNSGVPKSILSEIVSKKTSDIDIDSQIKMLELLFSLNQSEFKNFYTNMFLFNKITVDDKVRNFIMDKLNTSMKIVSYQELKQEEQEYNYKLFHDFKTYLNTFFNGKEELLSIKEIQIIYQMIGNILNSIDLGIISSKKENISFRTSDSGEKILTNLSKNLTDLLDFEFYKIKKNDKQNR